MAVNMSYCRFENTLAALREAREWLLDFDEGESNAIERQALRDLQHECIKFANDYASLGFPETAYHPFSE